MIFLNHSCRQQKNARLKGIKVIFIQMRFRSPAELYTKP